MSVALDATYSLDRAPSGVAVYSSNLIRALCQSAPQERFLLCCRPNRFWRALRAPLPAENCSRRLLHEAACLLYRNRVSVFHGLNQRLPRVRFHRSVTTFHDLFVLTGDYSTPDFRARFTALARDAAKRSDHVIAVSGYTADQVAKHLYYERARITVIHHGVNPVPEIPPEQLRLFRRQQRLETDFVLHVGALQTRKNIRRLVEAFERLEPPVQLVLAGAEGYGAAGIMARIQAGKARDRIRICGYTDGETLAKLYRSATVLAFPSLEEGFGLPVLEAMSAGLPVMTSNRSSLPEVAGDAALLVDPEDVNAIAETLERVLASSRLRQRLCQAGLRRAAEFSWIKAAHETLKVYHRIL